MRTGARSAAALAAALVCAALMAPPADAADEAPILLAESGIILRETEDWKVIRTPSGRIIKKSKKPAAGKAAPSKKEPVSGKEPSPAAQAATGEKGRAATSKQSEVAKTAGKKDRRLIFGAGAQYNPLNGSVGPIVVARPHENYGLALWHGSGDYNLSELRVFGYSYMVPGLIIAHAGAGLLYLNEEVKEPGISEDITAFGGSVFGGLALEIKKRVHIIAEAYAARISTKESIGGARVEIIEGVIGASAGIVVYIW